MQLHIDNGAGQIFNRRKALIEGAGGLDLVDQGLGHRRTGLIVQGKTVQHFRGQEPVFVHLARHFDKVARHPCEVGIIDILQEVVDAVPKFVEQGVGIIEADQGRGPVCAGCEIIVVRGQNGSRATEALLAAIGGHPSA